MIRYAKPSALLVAMLVIAASMNNSVNKLQAQELQALDGEWIYVEDLTEGKSLEKLGPPMSARFSMKVEADAVILNGHGSSHRDVRIALLGAITEIAESSSIYRYHGSWSEGTFAYEVNIERLGEAAPNSLRQIRRSFRVSDAGLVVTVAVDPPILPESTGLYRHAEDIEMPAALPATINDIAWLSGDWVGKRSTGSSIEERWSPPLGGAMLAISRSVNTSGKMFAFEYLRIVEREGGLVYVAQPGGKTAVEYVLTELSESRAVFDNPRHDYPKRIVYELSAEGKLSATIGYMVGGTPTRFEFEREAD